VTLQAVWPRFNRIDLLGSAFPDFEVYITESVYLQTATVGGIADIGGRKTSAWILSNMHYEYCSSIPKLIECKNI